MLDSVLRYFRHRVTSIEYRVSIIENRLLHIKYGALAYIYTAQDLFSFAQLHQNAAGGFRVQKGNFCTTGPFAGFLVNQPDTFFF